VAVTQADIDKLDAAIAGSGAVEELEVAGQRYRFRSVDDMLKLRAVLTQQLNPTVGTSRFAATSKGI
jgi:hypothetical protein